jgi:predicted TIM-barrel fold metal-dependent hydrolase
MRGPHYHCIRAWISGTHRIANVGKDMATLETASAAPLTERRITGATDCHLHIFGPLGHYPFTPDRAYTPPEASLASYDALAGSLGLERMVIVQPSVYGKDNRCTLDMTELAGKDRARAVVVVDNGVSDSQLQDMHGRGARGIRINALTPAGVPLDQIQTLARRIAPLGWHLQFWISGPQIVALTDVILALPVPAVFDHMGQFAVEGGMDHPELLALLRLLQADHCWVKLCGYRVSKNGPPYDDVREPAKAMIAAAPTRCIWGTDWPHPHMQDKPYPDDRFLLELLTTWAGDEATLKRILVDNPARLYGF